MRRRVVGLTAAVAGASGYAGGELLRLLVGHPAFGVEGIGALAAHGAVGRPLGEVHPQLPPLADRVLVDLDELTATAADVVFLALPHGTSARVAGGLPDTTVLVDLGADHRLRSASDWARWYGGEHAGAWPYGLPELPGARAALTGARRVAVPGCHATAVALALAPLLGAGLCDSEDLVVVAASGTSGAGRAANAGLLGSEVMGDLAAYKVARHQHTPEIRQSLAGVAGREVRLSLTTVLAPTPRGILATCTARSQASEPELRAALASAYDLESLVHLLPEGRWPHTAATVGSAAAQLQVAVDTDAGRAVVVCALDNLGKGAASQAVQCANLALGLPETAGLSACGVAP